MNKRKKTLQAFYCFACQRARRVCIPCADLHSEFLWPCVYLHAQPSPVWTAEGRLGEGGGIHQEEAAPGVAAVLLRPQCLAVQEESRYARTNARLHSGSGTELLLTYPICPVLSCQHSNSVKVEAIDSNELI